MKIILWQNIISSLQSYFIRELSDIYEVVLVVEQQISTERIKQGWKIPNMGNAKVIVVNNDKEVFSFLKSNTDCIHFFSGFTSYPLIKIAFKEIIKTNKVNIIAESAIQMGWKKHFRFFIYKYYFYKYDKSINFIFAMGDIGVNWYNSIGFSQEKLINFQYFTELPEAVIYERNNDKFQLLFIGQLIKRKGVDNLLTAISSLKNKKFHLTIIGDGILKKDLLRIVKLNNLENNITFKGNLDNKEAMLFINNIADCLILPSRFDGWGAVVNEALSRGVQAIVSDKCGACKMIINNNFGKVYSESSISDLVSSIDELIENKSKFDKRMLVKEYNDHFTITPVRRFVKIIEGFYNK